MDHNSFLVWWLLGIPIVLAIVDRMMIGKTSAPSAGTASGYIARQDGRPASHGPTGGSATRPL